MTKTKYLLLGREGPLLDAIQRELGKSFDVPLVFVEKLRPARLNKIQRMFRESALWQKALIPADVLLLAWFHRSLEKKVSSLLRRYSGAENDWIKSERVFLQNIDDLRILTPYSFDIFAGTLVFGTSIIPADVLRALPRPVINFHGGMVPSYRNVHGDFWATARRDFTNWGTSFLLLTEGIDDGPIIHQERNNLQFERSVSTNAANNFVFGLRLMNSAVQNHLRFGSQRPQPKPEQVNRGHNQTPRTWDWVRHGLRP